MKYDLVIAHRVCPALAKSAAGFTDKFEMIKATSKSLAEAIDGIATKLIVILDGCPVEYGKFFDEIFGGDKIATVDYERISTPAIGNHATYAKQMDVLDSFCGETEYLYFSEDDYIYRKDAFRAMMDFLKTSGVDFVTPLDHPDRYSHSVPERKSVEVRVSGYCHWREVGTTCCTFMTSRAVFREAHKLLECYGKGGCDGTLWLGLTKDSVFSLYATVWVLLRYLVGWDKTWSRCIAVSAWRFHKLNLLFSRRYRLWGPIPTLAVHLAKPSLPPFSEELYLVSAR